MIKKKWFQQWLSCPIKNAVTKTFQQLSWTPTEETVIQKFDTLKEFVSYVYTGKNQHLNIVRQTMFMTSDKEKLRILPPSDDALAMNVRRGCYQAGWVWGNSLLQGTSSSPDGWGWTISDNKLLVTWATTGALGFELLAKATYTCKCTTAKCTSCKCAGINCLKFCRCKRKCGR